MTRKGTHSTRPLPSPPLGSLPFEAISFFVSLNRESSDEGTNVLLDATQETVTVLLTSPDG